MGSPDAVNAGASGAPDITGTATWLLSGDEAIYTVLHRPAPAEARRTAVLMIPPFGWEEIESHRARRDWALHLARAGFATARFDLPGSGDSTGSPRDGDLYGRWLSAIGLAAAWLAERTGADRVVGLGVGIGGLLAADAAAHGAPLDDLILWGSWAQGRAHVREMQAYGQMVASKFPDEDATAGLEGVISVAGFILSDATREGLRGAKVADMSFPVSDGRALLLGRDEHGPDPKLAEALTAAGFAVTSAGAPDYLDLIANPQSPTLERPTATFNATIAWLVEGEDAPAPDVSARPVHDVPAAGDSIVIATASGPVRERLISLALDDGTTTAVLTEPDDRPASSVGALLLNSGAIRKIGPHRFSVELARRWAADGVRCVRIDHRAVGDADGPWDVGIDERPLVTPGALVSESSVAAVVAIVHELVARGVAQQWVLAGHCSGAYLGFHAAIDATEVVATFGVNQQAFFFDEGKQQAKTRKLIVAALRRGLWRRIRERGIAWEEVRQVLRAFTYPFRNRGARGGQDQTQIGSGLLDRLADRGVAVMMVQSREGDLFPVLDTPEFQALLPRWSNLEYVVLPSNDHMASAPWLQALMHEKMDRGLERVLSAAAAGAATRAY